MRDKHTNWLFWAFALICLAFGIWAMLGPCSKPIHEAPAWCISR